MAKTKISEFSATPANNTDIDGININEGCAPSGINDAIRELMAQLKDFQTGAVGDSFNGPIGTSTAAAGAFTTLSATGAITSTLATGTAPLVIASTTKVANLNVDLLDGADWAAPAALGSTTPAAVSATTLSASSTVTLSGGTANGVAYLNGSKVVTSGSALTFDGSDLAVGNAGGLALFKRASDGLSVGRVGSRSSTDISMYNAGGVTAEFVAGANELRFNVSAAEQMRLTSTGLGIGTSSPSQKLTVSGGIVRIITGSSGSAANNGILLDNNATGSNNYLPAINWNTGTLNWATIDGLRDPSGGYGGTLRFNTMDTSGVTAERMRVNESGNLGIGTSSPASKLTVSRGGSVGVVSNFTDGLAQGLALTTGTGYFGFYNPNYGAITFRDGGNTVENMRLTDSGNLGLGVTPSAWNSDYKAFNYGSAGLLYGRVGSQEVALGTNWYRNSAGSFLYSTTGFASYYAQVGSTHSWWTAPSGTAGNAITFTQAMTLDANAQLQIGTTTASGKVTIDNTGASTPLIYAKSADQAGARIALSNTGSGGQTWQIVAGDVGVGNSGLSFYDGTATRARIDSSGNLLCGTTSGATDRGTFASPTASVNVLGLVTTDDSSGGNFIMFRNSAYTLIGSVARVTTTNAVVYNTTSDYRLKTVTGAVSGQGARIDALKPIDYQWKEGGQQARGFLAHEFQTVYPNSVTGNKDAVDADGNPVYQSMQASTSEVIADLVAEIQSLRKRLADAGI